jgi:hypothetical protein
VAAVVAIWLALLLAAPAAAPAAPAATAKKRVVLLGVEGKRGGVATDAVAEVLQREVTVLSESAFRRSQVRLGTGAVSTSEAFARVAADVRADAIVLGSWRQAGKAFRLVLSVREGKGGLVAGEIVVQVPGGRFTQAVKDDIATGLLPVVAAAPTHREPPPPPPVEEPPPEEPVVDEESGLGPVTGKMFTYARVPFEGDRFQQVSASLWMRARPRLTELTSAAFEVALDGLEASQLGDRQVRLALREAYVALHGSGFLMRAGQQIIPWGSSDVVNPTDFLTARDLRFFVTDSEQTRLGAISLLLQKAWPNLELTLVTTPVHPSTVLLVPPSALPAGVTLAPTSAPDVALERTEVAARVKLSGSGWDVAAVGFRGYNHTPEFELVSADAMGIVVRQAHHEIFAAGLDGSASFGKLVMRAEASYVGTENPDGKNPTIMPSRLFGVFGVERPFGEHFRAQLQGLLRAYPIWARPRTATNPDPMISAARQGVAIANALLLDYQEQVRPAGTLRLAYASDEGGLEAEIFAAVNFIPGDFVVRPLVGWRPTTALLLQLGAEYYGGSRERPLGSLAPFAGAFIQGTFTF